MNVLEKLIAALLKTSSGFFINVQCVKETEILAEKHPPQGV